MARTTNSPLKKTWVPAPDEHTNWSGIIPFSLVHLAAIVGVWSVGFSWTGVALCVALYYVRMFGVAGGYHRYFAHRTFKTSRAGQFALAWLACSSAQKGP